MRGEAGIDGGADGVAEAGAEGARAAQYAITGDCGAHRNGERGGVGGGGGAAWREAPVRRGAVRLGRRCHARAAAIAVSIATSSSSPAEVDVRSAVPARGGVEECVLCAAAPSTGAI